jgi:hypothetical protein
MVSNYARDLFIDEVKSVELFIPHKAMIKRDWILSEIDKKIKIISLLG